ncbi:MAG: nitroreductase family protein [Methanospirillaceae archaeon]|nr:nitroreductase family protein [Methanospirillaceae archaeon]
MDISELEHFLSSRSSVRQYDDREIEGSIIDRIITLTATAPSAGNRESWDVIVVTDEGIREMLSDASFSQEHVAQAPVLLVVVANYVRSMSRYGQRGILYAVLDATIAATYMMLAAHAQHLGTCWVSAFEEEMISSILSLPGHIRPVTILTLGYSTQPDRSPPRMDTNLHIHREQWFCEE